MQVKIYFTIILCLMYSAASQADYDASELNKLFTDKSQREEIDAARSGKKTGNDLQQTTKVKVSGYVTRSDGKSVVWVNDKNTRDSSKVGDVKVQQSTVGDNKKVTISVDGKTTRLKPGEIWSKETGNVKEGY
jgi:hypothetical protein